MWRSLASAVARRCALSEDPQSLRGGEASALRVEQDTVPGPEVPAELSNPGDLSRAVRAPALHEDVVPPAAHDAEAGVPLELLLDHVAQVDAVQSAHEQGPQDGVADTGVPREEEIGARGELLRAPGGDREAVDSLGPEHDGGAPPALELEVLSEVALLELLPMASPAQPEDDGSDDSCSLVVQQDQEEEEQATGREALPANRVDPQGERQAHGE